MKTLIVALVLVATACAFDMQDIPSYMKDRLDRFVELKQQWQSKWVAMTEVERKHYEEVLLARLENLPQIELARIHDRVESMPVEKRVKLLAYLRRRFPVEESETFQDDTEEIDYIVSKLPEMIRNKINNEIHVRFQEATAYMMNEEEVDEDLNFPDIPEIVDIPEVDETEGVGYSDLITDEVRNRLDEFLLKREDWRRKWEKLPEEKRNVLESYINAKLE